MEAVVVSVGLYEGRPTATMWTSSETASKDFPDLATAATWFRGVTGQDITQGDVVTLLTGRRIIHLIPGEAVAGHNRATRARRGRLR